MAKMAGGAISRLLAYVRPMTVYLFDVDVHRWAVRWHLSRGRRGHAILDDNLAGWEQASPPGWYDRFGVRLPAVALSLEQAAAKAIARAGLT